MVYSLTDWDTDSRITHTVKLTILVCLSLYNLKNLILAWSKAKFEDLLNINVIFNGFWVIWIQNWQ